MRYQSVAAITSPKSEPALELHSWAAPSVEAHHHSDDTDAGRNSGRRRIKKTLTPTFFSFRKGAFGT